MVTEEYLSALGKLVLAAENGALVGLWFEGQKYFGAGISPDAVPGPDPALDAAKAWLDAYFAGQSPDPQTVPLALHGSAFQKRVWAELQKIPFGETTTYGAIAKKLGCRSAQAVGSAVGRNPVSILVPCHRVLGADGALTGYAGGTERKLALLRHEGALA